MPKVSHFAKLLRMYSKENFILSKVKPIQGETTDTTKATCLIPLLFIGL